MGVVWRSLTARPFLYPDCQSRLGLQLGGGRGEVRVLAFTIGADGAAGAAELGGKIRVGDRLVRLNGRSTRGMNYAEVAVRADPPTVPCAWLQDDLNYMYSCCL